jgi:hypothetical protein
VTILSQDENKAGGVVVCGGGNHHMAAHVASQGDEEAIKIEYNFYNLIWCLSLACWNKILL